MEHSVTYLTGDKADNTFITFPPVPNGTNIPEKNKNTDVIKGIREFALSSFFNMQQPAVLNEHAKNVRASINIIIKIIFLPPKLHLNTYCSIKAKISNKIFANIKVETNFDRYTCSLDIGAYIARLFPFFTFSSRKILEVVMRQVWFYNLLIQKSISTASFQ